MNRTYIIVESEDDAKVLRQALRTDVKQKLKLVVDPVEVVNKSIQYHVSP